MSEPTKEKTDAIAAARKMTDGRREALADAFADAQAKVQARNVKRGIVPADSEK